MNSNSYSRDRLVILDADGTTVDAFAAIDRTFAVHGMDIGSLTRFQKRRNLFKYLGGAKEFPRNLRKQIGRQKRARLIATLTEVYREEGRLYPGIADLLDRLAGQPGVRLGIVTRNITRHPVETLETLFRREGFDPVRFDFLVHLPLALDKLDAFREIRTLFRVNPAIACACGDEGKDYLGAIGCGIQPFIVSYGFEDFERLNVRHGIPEEIISRTPSALAARLLHAMNPATSATMEQQPRRHGSATGVAHLNALENETQAGSLGFPLPAIAARSALSPPALPGSSSHG